ncbi:MAG: hypothetical protein V3T53_12340 [Phycisphaerales bacterium]
MDIESNCRKEVVELHEFFQQWFTGELPQTEEALDRFVSVVAEGFHIVSPAGRIMQRDRILDAVRGGYRSGPVKIWIKNHTHRLTLGDLALVTYEEWQSSGDETRGRLSSALLRVKAGLLNDLQWLHVHETWLPETAVK